MHQLVDWYEIQLVRRTASSSRLTWILIFLNGSANRADFDKQNAMLYDLVMLCGVLLAMCAATRADWVRRAGTGPEAGQTREYWFNWDNGIGKAYGSPHVKLKRKRIDVAVDESDTTLPRNCILAHTFNKWCQAIRTGVMLKQIVSAKGQTL